MVIIRKGQPLTVELIKKANLSTHIEVYLFQDVDKRSRYCGKYIVASRHLIRGNVQEDLRTLSWTRYHTLQYALSGYLDDICRYA